MMNEVEEELKILKRAKESWDKDRRKKELKKGKKPEKKTKNKDWTEKKEREKERNSITKNEMHMKK